MTKCPDKALLWQPEVYPSQNVERELSFIKDVTTAIKVKEMKPIVII